MRHLFLIFSILLFSLTIISCGSDDEEYTNDTDTTAPTIAEVTAVTTPTSDTTPDYTFSSDEAGNITYGGSCSSSNTSASSGNNTVTFTSLSEGTYSNCTIIVKDSAENASNTLAITSFEVISSYIAVGNSGIILTSSDGSSWTLRSSGTNKSLTGVTYANDKFLIVGGTDGNVLTSSDGTSWSSSSMSGDNTTVSLNDVTYKQ